MVKQQQCHELRAMAAEDQSKLVLPHWSNPWEEKNWVVCQHEQLEAARYIPNSNALHQLNTFHPTHLTKGRKNYPHFTAKDWGMHTWYSSLGCQTRICLHCVLQVSAKLNWKKNFHHMPCWKKRNVCVSRLGQHQAQISRESLSPWLCSLRHGTTSASMVTWF